MKDKTASLTRRVSRKLECMELVLWEPKRDDRLWLGRCRDSALCRAGHHSGTCNSTPHLILVTDSGQLLRHTAQQ